MIIKDLILYFSRSARSAAMLSVGVALFSGLATTAQAVPNMSVDQVLADGCNITPPNFVLSELWESKMDVLEAVCLYPAITQRDINGRRKPRAYTYGSENVSHDVNAVKVLNGAGHSNDTFGVAPRTSVSLGLYCSNSTYVLDDGKLGDVAFSLRSWSATCRLLSEALPTMLIYGIDNQNKFVGDNRNHRGMFISSGGNYGRAVDFFTPGGGSTLLGGGNVSYALPEFAGIVAALNAALISENRAILNNDTIKSVLEASSNKVYLSINGTRGIYPETQACSLPSCKYYGQIVNLKAAIAYALGTPRLTLLTVINEVINDNGGNAQVEDFDLRVSGGVYNGSDVRFSGEWLEIDHSTTTTYTLSVDSVPGYTKTGVECTDDNGGTSLSHPVILLVGQSATCTITNDDVAPDIKIAMDIANENDGDKRPEDFTLRLSGKGYNRNIPIYSGDLPIAVDSNTSYRVSYDPMPGYTQTGIRCKDNDTTNTLPHPVTLNEGQSVTCTISNIDREDASMFVIPVRNGRIAIINL